MSERATELSSSRPYRSHKTPACSACRKRKSRCTVDVVGQSCLICRLNGSICDVNPKSDQQTAEYADKADTASEPPSSHKKRASSGASSKPLQAFKRPGNAVSAITTLDETDLRSSHIVGPASARDVRELEKYACFAIEGKDNASQIFQPRCNIYAESTKNPVIYHNVGKMHGNIQKRLAPGTEECEVLQRLLEPFTEDLVTLYFQHINPYFPLLDKNSFLKLHKRERSKLPPALLCELYATSILLWEQSPTLAKHPCPNQRYCWSLAVKALNDDFHCPGLATIVASLLALGGRPTSTATGNAINQGRTVALAHSLGLNRDPSAWALRDVERRVRIRLWWAVLLHDWWSSLAHGIPPHISPSQFDTPLPQYEDLASPKISSDDQIASRSFIALCSLTLILGSALRFVYNLKPREPSGSQASLSILQSDLTSWHTMANTDILLPYELCSGKHGLQNLRLSYLCLRQLLTRLELDSVLDQPSVTSTEIASSKMQSLEAATAVVDFITGATGRDLDSFWLPYTSYHLTSTGMLLLRLSLLETSCVQDHHNLSAATSDISSAALEQVGKLLAFLRSANDNHRWDLAEFCLADCEQYFRLRTDPSLAPASTTRESNASPNSSSAEFKSPSMTSKRKRTSKVLDATGGTARDLWKDKEPTDRASNLHAAFVPNHTTTVNSTASKVTSASSAVGAIFEVNSTAELDFSDLAFGPGSADIDTLFPDLFVWDNLGDFAIDHEQARL